MDDMWSLEVWDRMNFFFPEYNNGSRVLVTTRLSNIATNLTDSSSLLNIKSLDEISSWSLFSKTVFGKDSTSPCELEEIGKKIVNKCNGHPLAIVVIGGLLAKSQRTRKHWEEIEANLISRVNSENDEYCLRILRMSYNHLPVCLKPCFIYMGVFKEDYKIYVPALMKLWVSEGFVKPKNNKSLETTSEEYLKELVDRNLILVARLGSLGNVKYCKMHDLLRDLCLKEAKKQRFYYHLDSPRGFVVRLSSSRAEFCDAYVRSIHSYDNEQHWMPSDSRLLRILSLNLKSSLFDKYCYHMEELFQFVNLRCVALLVHSSKIPCSISLLWNLHTFTVSTSRETFAPTEIWKMHQLRHLGNNSSQWYLPDPPSESVIMENLQTLKGVKNLNLNEEVVKRIPNIKKFCVAYNGKRIEIAKCLSNLQLLSKLKSFTCRIQEGGEEFLQKIIFPQSLKKLTLVSSSSYFGWEDILQKIGSLPLIQKLTLYGGVFRTRKWETVEGQFPSLKVLELTRCDDLESWMVSESSHFPRLQQLRLTELQLLEEIPSAIGETATLKSIVLRDCSEAAVLSAKKIVEEQEELHGEQLDMNVRVVCQRFEERDLRHLASPNFRFG